jgi:hypothetical protein
VACSKGNHRCDVVSRDAEEKLNEITLPNGDRMFNCCLFPSSEAFGYQGIQNLIKNANRWVYRPWMAMPGGHELEAEMRYGFDAVKRDGPAWKNFDRMHHYMVDGTLTDFILKHAPVVIDYAHCHEQLDMMDALQWAAIDEQINQASASASSGMSRFPMFGIVTCKPNIYTFKTGNCYMFKKHTKTTQSTRISVTCSKRISVTCSTNTYNKTMKIMQHTTHKQNHTTHTHTHH